MFKQVKQVISYTDDVYVWVYLDYVDRVLRYEAFVVGYDESGEQSTLEFVLEEGVLDNLHEVPLFVDLLQTAESTGAWVSAFRFTSDGQLITSPPLLHLYSSLDAAELVGVHQYFALREEELKRNRQHRWTRMLKALGYDVIVAL